MAIDYNIFVVLGLKPDIADRDNRVRAEVDKQYRSWMNRANMGARAKEKIAFFKRIRDDINANPTLIAEHASLYAEIVKREKIEQEKEIRREAAIFVVNGFIEEKSLKEIVAKNNMFTEAEILKIIGAQIKRKRSFSYKDDPSVQELPATIYRQITADLEKQGKKSLYDFLGLRPNADTDTIVRTATRIYNENQNRLASSAKVEINNLVGHCRSLLGDPAKRRSYDKTLSNAGFLPVRDKIMRMSIINPEQYKALLEECTRAGIPRDKAEYLIYQTAEAKNITIVESAANDALLTCRFCGSLNNPSANVCGTCGMPLVIECPKCGKKSTDTNELKCTKCGFAIGEMPSADLHVKSAETALSLGNTAEAQRQLEAARRLWPSHPRIRQVEADLARAEKEVSGAIAEMKKLTDARRYYAARPYLSRIGFSTQAQALRSETETAIDSAEKLVQQASAIADANRRIDQYMQVLTICADCKPALDKLRLTPPAAPASMRSAAGQTGIRLEWSKATSAYITYDIIRKANGRPATITDGTRIGTVTGNAFDDTTAEPGVSYYYAVFSACGDIKSRTGATTAAPAILTPEIDPRSVGFSTQATSIGLNWKLPAHAKSVRVLRDGVEVRTVAGSTFNDSGLTPERDYRYTLRTVYVDCAGGEHVTPGISLKAKPVAPPDAVRLTLTDGDARATLQWSAPRKGTVAVFVSDKPFKANPNDVVNLDALNARRLNVVGTSCTVNKDFSGERFFMAVTIDGATGVAGNTVSLISVQSPVNPMLRPADDAMTLSWEWGNSTEVQVTYRFDGGVAQTRRIAKPSAPLLRIPMMAGAASLTVDIAGCCTTAAGKPLVDPKGTSLSASVRTVRVNFTSAKSGALFGLFGRDKFTLTLRPEGAVDCDINVYVGEGLPPVNLAAAPIAHIIRRGDLSAGSDNTVTFNYSRRDSSRPLFFRLVPADAANKNIKIIPDSRKI